MTRIKRPVRGSRVHVRIPQITRKKKKDDATKVPIVVLMKVSHAKLIGVSQMRADDPAFFGTRTGSFGGTTGSVRYVKNIGGFRRSSYIFTGEKLWGLTELTEDAQGNDKTQSVEVRSISIGFPGGVSLIEILDWVKTLNSNFRANLRSIRTPQGRSFAYIDSGETAPDGGF